MAWSLYYFIIRLMVLGIRISSIWKPKSAKWIDGRRDWRSIISLPAKSSTRIWFHVSSLGEFEQARPVIERLKKQYPSLHIILSFFSPSGYEIRKNYAFADVFYLPADLPGNAKDWLDKISPDLAVFVKYDLWPGYLKALSRNAIPYLLISAHYQPGMFTSWSVPMTKALLKKARRIFLQNDTFLEKLKSQGFTNLHVSGDTRIDRTLALPNEAPGHIPEVLKQLSKFDLIAGSTWPEDERLLIPLIESQQLKTIIAPHDVSETNVARLMSSFSVPVARLSKLSKSDRHQIIIVDSIGLLAFLYSVGKVAYVGGGFGKSIHNILEPAAHGLPVIFGPKHTSFPEAGGLIEKGAARVVHDQNELATALLYFLKNPSEGGLRARQYLEKNQGATDMVSAYITESIPFGGK